MTSELEQLKISYETLSMSPEAISIDRQLDLAAVKAGLMQCSSKYRKDCGREDEGDDGLNFNQEQLKDVNQIIYDTAKYATYPDGSTDYKTRLSAATYIRDDKKGRKEVVKQVGNQTFNVLQFNEKLISLRDRKKEQLANIFNGNNGAIAV